MDPVNSFNYLINHLAAVMTKQSDQVLREQLGIGLSQYRILLVLEWNPKIQQKSIAASLGQSQPSITRQIKVLKSKGLLSSKEDKLNKRKHLSVPTALGMQITEAATDLLKRNFLSDFNDLNDAKLTKLNEELQLIHQKVCKAGKLGACDHQLRF